MGNFLQGQSHTNWGRHDKLDKEGPHRDMGMVRDGLDAGLEKIASTYGNKQEPRLSPTKGRGMVTDSKPMVEVSHKPTCGPIASDEQLRTIRTNIREAAFRKIFDRSGNKLDIASDCYGENLTGQACGMYDDGALASGKAYPFCKADDFRDHSYQVFSRNAKDHQALNNTFSGQNDVEKGGDGSMDIEGLRG